MSAAKKTLQEELADAVEINRRKHLEINDLKRTVKGLQQENDTAAAIREEIFQLASHTPDPPKWLLGQSVKNGARGGPMVMLSDLHYSEVVNRAQVGGVNAFNRKIAAD